MDRIEKIPYSTPQLQVLWFEAEAILSASVSDNIVDTEYEDPFGSESDGW